MNREAAIRVAEIETLRKRVSGNVPDSRHLPIGSRQFEDDVYTLVDEDLPWLLARVRTLEAGLAEIASMATQDSNSPLAGRVCRQIEEYARATLAGEPQP